MDRLDLRQREDGGDVERQSVGGQVRDQRGRGLPSRVGDGDLHEDVVAPGGDQTGLAAHFVELVGEHLEGDRLVDDDMARTLWAKPS